MSVRQMKSCSFTGKDGDGRALNFDGGFPGLAHGGVEVAGIKTVTSSFTRAKFASNPEDMVVSSVRRKSGDGNN